MANIDDAHAPRDGGTKRVLGCTAKAPSMLGTFLRIFRWGSCASWIGRAGGYWPGPGLRASDRAMIR